jgi:single-strand DNA-binding protein
VNRIQLTGRLVDDPQLAHNPHAGKAKATFRVAVSRPLSRDRRDNPNVQHADFFNAVAFGKTAEIIAQHSRKGDLIGISGAYRIDQYVGRDGNKRTWPHAITDQFEFLAKNDKAGQASGNGQATAQATASVEDDAADAAAEPVSSDEPF